MFPTISITSSIAIPTYFLVISLSVVVCLLWLNHRVNKTRLSRQIALDLSFIIMICGFIGARLMHVFYENFEYYSVDWKRVIYFWDGGFVFYGGALIAALFGFIFIQIKAPHESEKYLDLFAPLFPFAYSLGRTGCLFAGCCYGRYCDLPWAVGGRHPTQVYASLWEFGVTILLLGIQSIAPEHRHSRVLRKDGAVFYIWMILHGVGRILMETFRDDFRGPSLGLSISTWISICVILLGSYLLFRKPARGSSTLSA